VDVVLAETLHRARLEMLYTVELREVLDVVLLETLHRSGLERGFG
jgi:hypothetical protein